MSPGAYDRGQQRAPADEPGLPSLVLSYPHLRPSLEPKRLRREEIWAVAEEARRQLCRGPRPKVELAPLSARCTRLRVNGLPFELRRQFDRSIDSEDGHSSIGAVEHDPSWPAGATISIDSTVIGEREDLGRSTAAHELGHAIFDSPTWIQSAQYTTSKPALRYDLRETVATLPPRWTGWSGAPTSSWAASWHSNPAASTHAQAGRGARDPHDRERPS